MKQIILLIGIIIGAGALLFLTACQSGDDGLDARIETEELAEQDDVVRHQALETVDEAIDTADDLRITIAVESKLAFDPELSIFGISASFSEGIVTLTGSVESPEHVSRATALALETEGVREVISKIAVD